MSLGHDSPRIIAGSHCSSSGGGKYTTGELHNRLIDKIAYVWIIFHSLEKKEKNGIFNIYPICFR